MIRRSAVAFVGSFVLAVVKSLLSPGDFRRPCVRGGIKLQPQDHPYGVCTATFSTADQPEAVLDHYRAQWTAAGWSLNPPEPSSPPPPEGEEIMELVEASATRDGMTYRVSVELIGEEPTYVLLAGADQ